MKNYIINGLNIGFAKNVTGIQRVCHELVYRLDELLENTDINVWYIYNPEDLNRIIVPNELKNIQLIKVYDDNKPLWKSRVIRKALQEKNAILCCLSFETVFTRNQIYFIYDLRAVTTRFDTTKIRIKYKLKMQLQKHMCKIILTDSYFQKKEIEKYFKIRNQEAVQVLYNGYEHINKIKSDYGIFEKYPQLKDRNFFYSLASLAPHKNLKWIIEVAKRNKDKIFVIAGGKDLATWKDNIENREISNVIFTGYVSDEESKALMEKCVAFIHPAKYEGFGIPPLEALACGTKIFLAKATCLPEIYEDCAVYFEPDDYDVNLDEMLKIEVNDASKILTKCSWDKSARKMMNILESL